LIVVCEFLSVLYHSFNVIGSKPILIIGDNNFFTISSPFVFSRYLKNTVSIDLEGNFNLWYSSRCWWNTSEVEFTKNMVIFCHWTFTFIYLNGYSMLVVRRCGKDLRLFCWNYSVPVNKTKCMIYLNK
ncbi:NAD-specific glutamate dehydrogenase, partial [Habropoda laboriosa]